jgi:hypothetical protein
MPQRPVSSVIAGCQGDEQSMLLSGPADAGGRQRREETHGRDTFTPFCRP